MVIEYDTECVLVETLKKLNWKGMDKKSILYNELNIKNIMIKITMFFYLSYINFLSFNFAKYIIFISGEAVKKSYWKYS